MFFIIFILLCILLTFYLYDSDKTKKNVIYLINLPIKLFKKLYNIIFNPAFFISSILIAFLVNSFFSVINKDIETYLPSPILYIIRERVYTLSIIICWSVISFIKSKYDDLQIEYNTLRTNLQDKNRQIEQGSAILAGKYGEFADTIHKNHINKIFSYAIKRFPDLEACHLYEFELLRYNNFIDIKLRFIEGQEQERVCINVIKQNYYNIQKDTYYKIVNFNNLSDIKNLITKKNQASNPHDIKRLEEIIGAKSKMLSKKASSLSDFIEKDKLTSKELKSRLQQILFNSLRDKLCLTGYGYEFNSNDIDSYRNSIIASIILQEGYIYMYNRKKSDKKDRVYFSTPIILDREYILNLTMHGGNSDEYKLKSEFEKIVIFIKDQYNKAVRGCV